MEIFCLQEIGFLEKYEVERELEMREVRGEYLCGLYTAFSAGNKSKCLLGY